MLKNIKKSTQLFGLLIITGLSMISCIKAELPNIEVDITNVTSTSKGFIKSNINENSVTIFVDTMQSKLDNLSILLEISEGATISPNPATVTDYREPQYFEIVSEDKEWVKVWEVAAKVVSENFPTKYNFENWENPVNTAYKIPFEIVKTDSKEEKMPIWATTNSSMSIVLSYIYGPALNYTHFGCCPSDVAVEGLSLKLETMDISYISPTMPFVSGCLFVGEFDGTDTDPLTGTHFGAPFNKRPLYFKGSYNYIPNKILSKGVNDTGLIEAVLYRVDQDVPYLTGYTIRDKSFENIVAYAEINPNTNTGGFTEFNIPFTYTKEVDDEDLKNWKYGLAVYFASSKDGDQYIGAGGTKLYIDNVEIVCE